MPWTIANPPSCAKNWTESEKKKCVAAANAVIAGHVGDKKYEESAIYACIHAAGKSTKKSEDRKMLLDKVYLINGEPVKLRDLVKSYMQKRNFDPNVGGGVDRDKLKASDFVFGDERKFPVVTSGDVMDAVHSWGRYKGKHTFEEFKRRLTALCHRKGFALPKSWGEKKKVEKSTNLNEVIRTISDAWREEFTDTGDSNKSYGWVEEVFDDNVIATIDDVLKKYPFEIADDGSFVWGEPIPVVRRVLYIPTTSVAKSEDEKSLVVDILKADEERRLVYGAVLKPGVKDSQGDICSEKEVELAAHRFLKSKISGVAMDEDHERDVSTDEACPVESWITPEIMKMGDSELPKGTWIMAAHVPDDAMWDKVKKHQTNGFSVKGWGKRKKIS